MADERARARRLWKQYGLTPEDYDALLAWQGGICAICGTAPAGTRLAVDHDHSLVAKVTKAKRTPEVMRQSVRGLLCWLCNHRRIGRGATPTLMRYAADYLEGQREKTQAHLRSLYAER